MREKILEVLEQNGRIDFKELAILIGEDEEKVAVKSKE
jgi:DNA-binding Lrp family transcriptional regulator